MAAIQQTTDNLFGGVSTQPDFKKLRNQVRESTNTYLDPVFGTTKRPGSRFLFDFGPADEFENAKIFFYVRDDDETYIGTISEKNIRMFNTADLSEATVDASASALEYLTASNPSQYKTLTIQDNTVIVNKEVVVDKLPDPAFTPNTRGTVVLKAINYAASYTIIIDGVASSWTTPNADQIDSDNSGTQLFLSAEQILQQLAIRINNPDIKVSLVGNSLELESKSGTAFTLDAVGGINSEALKSFQDSVNNISNVPDKSVDGRIVKIENTTKDDDDYYIKYVGADEAWEECKAPDVSPGLDPATMPHELVSTDINEFKFSPIGYEERLVGDYITNPDPSFVGQKINNVFFTNNRLGFLSGPNVVLSATSDYYNFFAKSATTVIDSDPIDINCNSTVPTKLIHSLPAASGVILFSNRQQFLMTADQQIYTPSSTFIRQISNYEVDENVDPVDLGTYQIFLQKTAGYTRVMAMSIPDVNQPPTVVDISKVVSEWISPSIDYMIASPINEFLLLSDRLNNDVYIYRKYSTGQEEKMQAWFKWKLPGNPYLLTIPDDTVFIVSEQADRVGVSSIELDRTLSNETVVTHSGVWDNPHLDFYVGNNPRQSTITQQATLGPYDPATKRQRIYVPFRHVQGLEPIVVTTTQPMISYKPQVDVETGWIKTLVKDSNGDVIWGIDPDQGTYFEVDTDLSLPVNGVVPSFVIGYKYDFEVEFPEFYYKEEDRADYNAFLNISRVRFAVGLTGALEFKVSAKGKDDWNPISPIIEADYYASDTGPLAQRYFFNVPIHQRSTNFMIKAFSDLPFPVSINMMTWQGIYSPRFYRRT